MSETPTPFPPPEAGPSGTIYRLDLDERASYVLIPNEPLPDPMVLPQADGTNKLWDPQQNLIDLWERLRDNPGTLLLLPAGWRIYRVPLAPAVPEGTP